MTSFEYTINDPLGVHARPAGMLLKELKKYSGCTINITKKDKTVNALKLMAIMQMCIKQGDTVTVSVDGENEETVAAEIEEFFKANL